MGYNGTSTGQKGADRRWRSGCAGQKQGIWTGSKSFYGRAGDAEEGRLDGSRWKRGVYPLRQDAQEGLEAGALYIAELDGQIVGSVILRREQDSAYWQASWQIPFEAPVFVVHTLAVDPAYRHRGVGRALLRHAAKVGREAGLQAIRPVSYTHLTLPTT